MVESRELMRLAAQIKVIKTGLNKIAETIRQIVEQLEEVEKGPMQLIREQVQTQAAMRPQPRPQAQQVIRAAPMQPQRAQFTEEYLGRLPWKQYKDAVGEWIFSNLHEAQLLLKAIKEAPDRQLVIGRYRYQVQRNGKFIGRTPAV